MAVVTLTTTSASPQTWTVPPDCPPGTSLKVEGWGAGSGGSGSSTSFRSGGAGGAYAVQPSYVVTSADVTSGITYTIQAGSAGTAAANSLVGPDTTFGVANPNIVRNSSTSGAVVGTIGSGGAMPTNWSIVQGADALTVAVTAFGESDPDNGLPYVDLHISGNPAAVTVVQIFFDATGSTCVASTTYNYSAYCKILAGGTGLTHISLSRLYADVSSNFGVINSTITPTTTATRFTASASSGVSGTAYKPTFTFTPAGTGAGNAIDLFIRVGAPQVELGSSATAFQETPATRYVQAKGGGATSGTTGGVGGAAASCIPSTGAFSGGNGATRTQGGGGGGAAGKDGAGATSSTGTGATGDNTHGGAANTSNVEGGGGGTAGNPANAGGDPGGGGGANTSTGSGLAGGRGQIRVTYTPFNYRLFQLQPILAQ